MTIDEALALAKAKCPQWQLVDMNGYQWIRTRLVSSWLPTLTLCPLEAAHGGLLQGSAAGRALGLTVAETAAIMYAADDSPHAARLGFPDLRHKMLVFFGLVEGEQA